MNFAAEVWVLVAICLAVVFFALWRGDDVETGFQFFRVQLFLRYRRNRRK